MVTCPPVIATALFERILKVMFALAATHARMERTAECTYVPSPTVHQPEITTQFTTYQKQSRVCVVMSPT